MKYVSTLLLTALLFMIACDLSNSLEEKLIGKWMMEEVIEDGNNVTGEHNPKGNRWIRFNDDGSFESGGDPYGDNAGNWEVDPDKSILYIFSSEESDNSEWNLVIFDNEMSWTGIGTPRKEGFKLIFRMSEQNVSQPNE